MPDPGNLLQADVPMEEEESGEEGERPHQNGVHHHNGDVIGETFHMTAARTGLAWPGRN